MSGQTDAVSRELSGGRIEGVCHPAFAGVLEAFAHNFEARGEVGAAVCVTVSGETMVDLWGGIADPETGRAWTADTVTTVFSSTKGATALCAHVLAARGALDIDAPMATYWPAFAEAGKAEATTRMALDHSLGLPVLRERMKPGAIYDWDYMVERLAAEAPFWTPGVRHGYHALTFGWTVGEVVRRIAGTSLGRFFREAIAEPLGLDFWIGLPEEIEPRVAPIIIHRPGKNDPLPRFTEVGLADRGSIPGLFLFNSGDLLAGGVNSRAAHAAEVPGANGITHGRGLAGMYAPLACGGGRDGVRLVDADTLARMAQVSSASHEDATLLMPTRFALGFMKSMDNRRFGSLPGSVILGERAFGHVGAGGSIGFADPAARLSFGYVMNRMGAGVLLNERGQALVDAAYRALGYRSAAGGVWIT